MVAKAPTAPPPRPVPVGELLDQLQAAGFAISPDVYRRVALVAEHVFPHGLPDTPTEAVTRQLGELMAPIVCRSQVEQQKFGILFNSFFQPPALIQGPDKPPVIPAEPTPRWPWLVVSLLLVLAMSWWLADHFDPDNPNNPNIETEATRTWPAKQAINCSIDFGVKLTDGQQVVFINRSPGMASRQRYVWRFGDGSDSVVSAQATVSHVFRGDARNRALNRVTLRAVGCTTAAQPYAPDTVYRPAPVAYRQSAEQKAYNLSGWVPLLLLGLGGWAGYGGWRYWQRRRREKQAVRPYNGPFFLRFAPQEDLIQPSPSLVNWAQQLQQRQESEQYKLAVGATIARTVRTGGMPAIVYEAVKRRPRYLVLIDIHSAFDQQAQLHAYLMGVLTARDVEMDVFFFHSDPRYAWNGQYPKGLPIGDLRRLYSTHYLVLVTEGARLLDYDTGGVMDWVVDAFGDWQNRALLTPILPVNWHYLEVALSQFFVLLPATPDGQVLLRDFLEQPDDTPTFEALMKQFGVLPGTPQRGIFGKTAKQLTLHDISLFLYQAAATNTTDPDLPDQLLEWACATAVFPTPNWSVTLAIGKSLEQMSGKNGLVTSTNLLRLTALPWLRQDTIPEPLRTTLLAQLSPEMTLTARQAVIDLLRTLEPEAGSLAYEEWQLRVWEQEFYTEKAGLRHLTAYAQQVELVKDAPIQQQLRRREQIQSRYIPSVLMLLVLSPLLLYLTPSQTQLASWAVPFYKRNATIMDSAVYFNNLAVKTVTNNRSPIYERNRQGVLLLKKSIDQRATFDAIYNLNAARYNLGVFQFTTSDTVNTKTRLDPKRQLPTLLKPVTLFDPIWIPDSAVTASYLKLLTTSVATDSIANYLKEQNRASANNGLNQTLFIGNGVDKKLLKALITKARLAFRWPQRINLQDIGSTMNAIKNYQPTPSQSDSLVGLDALRLILYADGPHRSTQISLEMDPRSMKANSLPPVAFNRVRPSQSNYRSNRIKTQPVQPQRYSPPSTDLNVVVPRKRRVNANLDSIVREKDGYERQNVVQQIQQSRPIDYQQFKLPTTAITTKKIDSLLTTPTANQAPVLQKRVLKKSSKEGKTLD